MLAKIRRETDVTKLINIHGFRPKASNQKEIVRLGVHLLDKAREGLGLRFSAPQCGIKPPYGTRNGQDYIDEARRCYIDPLLDDLETSLENCDGELTWEDAVGIRFDLFNNSFFRSAFPQTSEAFKKIAEYCGQSEETGSWFHVATSCREALGAFTRELQKQWPVVLPPGKSQSDVKAVLKEIAIKSNASDLLGNLIQASWAYVQSIVHRSAATKQDALRAYLWTGLLVSEVVLVVERHPK